MAPSDYIQARSNPQETRVTVDGQVYLPFLTMDVENEESIKQVVAEILKFQLPSSTCCCWKDWQVRPVSGGNTNKLFHVSGLLSSTSTNDDDATNGNNTQNNDTIVDLPDSILVRVFGGLGLIDRDVETSTYAALANQGMILRYYGRFENGRLEEWCDDKTHLVEDEMAIPAISKGIAKTLAQLHSQFEIPFELQEYHDRSQPPSMWTQLHSWLEQALLINTFLQMKQDTTLTERAAAQALLDLVELKDELTWLHSSVISTDAKVGFCHNDVLAGNILYAGAGAGGDESSSSSLSKGKGMNIQLIDFEYGGINYLSYDIANHFNEFAGGTSDPSGRTDYSMFPSPQLQRDFCEEYLKTVNNNGDGDGKEEAITSEKDINDLLKEIKGFVLANHLVWGLWGINQAATEGCQEFDYLQYGICRMERYYHDKREWETEQYEEARLLRN
jgi:ethanolamine kinase